MSQNLQKYWPLISLILISALAATAINFRVAGDGYVWMHYFMGIFLVFFATLKIFNPVQFADGFSMYDLLAKRWRPYAFIYPWIELLLGLFYLSFLFPILTYILTFLILTFGAIGVIRALIQGLEINCPCMGTVLNVPLSTVTLSEDLIMAFMALGMLLSLSFAM